MTTDKPPGPSLSDLASRINTEFAAIQKAEHDTNKSAVQRAISLGRTLSQAKEKIGHGKWEKRSATASGRNGSTTTVVRSLPALPNAT